MRLISIAFILLISSFNCLGQTPSSVPSPTPPANDLQEPVRVFTEEVLIPIFVRNSRGQFDPTLDADDVMVFEDDELQHVRSLQRVPSSVLLLLDTSGELNPVMNTNTTRKIAINLIRYLHSGSSMAAIQFGTQPEIVNGWTSDQDEIVHSLETKLSSSKRAHLPEALVAAVSELRKVSAGARHVVLITDGVGSKGDELALVNAVEELLSAHATVHVISYTSLGRSAISKRTQLVQVTNQKRKSASDVAEELMNPSLDWKGLRSKRIYVIVDTDIAMRRRKNDYKNATRQSEQWLSNLSLETGGLMFLPTSTNEMLNQAETIANEIGSQYVVAYAPKRPLADSADGEYRRLRVAARRGGIEVRTRRGYVTSSR